MLKRSVHGYLNFNVFTQGAQGEALSSRSTQTGGQSQLQIDIPKDDIMQIALLYRPLVLFGDSAASLRPPRASPSRYNLARFITRHRYHHRISFTSMLEERLLKSRLFCGVNVGVRARPLVGITGRSDLFS